MLYALFYMTLMMRLLVLHMLIAKNAV